MMFCSECNKNPCKCPQALKDEIEIDDFFKYNQKIRKDMKVSGLVVVRWDHKKHKPVIMDTDNLVLKEKNGIDTTKI